MNSHETKSSGGTSTRAVAKSLGLFVWILICFSAAAVGAQFSVDDWYDGLTRPAWSPPDWVFGPVWSLLYLSMAVAAWLVWKRAGLREAALPLSVFLIQLTLNGAWSWLFFGLHRMDLALLDIILLLLAIAATIALFYRTDRIAGWLLVPYLGWVAFATSLNFEYWRLHA